MADEGQQDEKTEAATARRLQRARDEGQVPVSRELTTFASMAAVCATFPKMNISFPLTAQR